MQATTRLPNSANRFSSSVFGPHTQVKRLFKALIFLTCKQNNHIFPDEISAVSVPSFDSYSPSKWQKVHKLGLCEEFRL